MFSIRTNVASIGAQRNLAANGTSLSKSMEKLSSGFRINRAGDDAAGLAISEKLRAQVRGLNQASRNALDGISMIQTAEAGLDEVQSIMQRMRELAVQGSNDTLGGSEREAITNELTELRSELQSISERTKFNGQGLLNGTLRGSLDTGSNTTIKAGTVLSTGQAVAVSKLDVGAAQKGKTLSFSFNSTTERLTLSDGTTSQSVALTDVGANGSLSISFDKLGVRMTLANANGTAKDNADLGGDLDGLQIATSTATSAAALQTGAYGGEETSLTFLDTQIETSSATEIAALKTALDDIGDGDPTRADFSALINTVDSALDYVSSERAKLGAAQNRLEHTIANVKAAAENLSASNSRIRDVDVASESAEMARGQILMQAGVSVLAQANQMSQLSLKLLG